MDHLNRGVGGEEICDGDRISGLRAHAPDEGLEAAMDQPRIERRSNATGGVLDGPDPAEKLVVFACHQDSAHDVRMTAEVLGARVHRDVRAQLERSLADRRRPGVVDGYHCPCLTSDGHHGLYIADREEWVGG